MDPAELARRVSSRDRVALGEALSLVEDRRAASTSKIISLLLALRDQAGLTVGRRVGFTGPPGAGKSSLVSAVAKELRRRRRTVGIVAVDPTSPKSGGALLGDRARIDPDPDDDGIFVRSMASGGDLGGLARAAYSVVDLLAASHDVVLIETVGVGQSETDIEFVADAVVLVLQPASGDILQFLKAGILEIPDAFVVNKIDLGEVAQRTHRDLASSLRAVRSAGLAVRIPEVLQTSALTGLGVPELVDAIDRVLEASPASFVERRIVGATAWSERMLARRVGEIGIEALGGRRAVLASLDRSIRRGALALEAVVDAERRARHALLQPGPS